MENIETSFSQNVIKTYGWNLQCMINVANPFSNTINLVHRGYLPLSLCIIFNVLFSETAEPIFFNLMWSLVLKGLKIYTNGHSPLIKMATMPIYGETLKIFFSRFREALRPNFGIWHRGLKVFQIFDRRGNRAGLLIQLWIFTYGRLFD